MMHTPARSGSNSGSFAKAAAEELVTMQSFVALLEQERGLLGSGKADALPALAAEKLSLMEVLSRCAEQRASLLGVAGMQINAPGVQQLLGSDPDAREIWNNLLEVARRAAELNACNGYLVHQQLAHVDRAMDALSGPRTALYSTSGVTGFRLGTSRSHARG